MNAHKAEIWFDCSSSVSPNEVVLEVIELIKTKIRQGEYFTKGEDIHILAWQCESTLVDER